MTTVQYTQSSYDPDKILEPGQYTGKINQIKKIDDPVEGDILHVIWKVEGFTITDKLKIQSPEAFKSGFAQWKLRNIAMAIGTTPPAQKQPGESLTYDVSLFEGKSCLVEVGSFVLPNGKTIATIERYIRIPSDTPVTDERELAAEQGAFSLPEKPVSTAESLDDEIPY